jgi:hypothetical protein
MNRTDVYKVIDGERDYQNSLIVVQWNCEMKPPIEAEILMMEEYLLKARK